MIKKSAILFFIMLAGLVLAYINQLLVSNNFTLEQYGIFNVILVTTSIIATFGRFGFLTLALKEIPSLRKQCNYLAIYKFIRFSLVVTLFSVAFITTCTLIFYKPLNEWGLFSSVGFGVFIISLSIAYSGLFSSFFRTFGLHYNGIVSTKVTEQAVLLVLLLSFGMFLKIELFRLIAAAFLISITLTFFIFYKLVILKNDFSLGLDAKKDDYNEWLRSGALISFIIGCQLVMKQTDTLMITSILGFKAAGLYSAASRLSELTGLFYVALNFIVAPKISLMFKNNNIGGIKDLINNYGGFLVLLTISSSTAFYLLGERLLGFFGPSFVESNHVLNILLINKIIGSFFAFGITVMTMFGLFRSASLLFIIFTLLNFLLNYLFIGRFGAEGAAYSTLISFLLLNVTVFFYVKLKVGLSLIPNLGFLSGRRRRG